MYKYIIGIDIGKKGGIAIYNLNLKQFVSLVPTPIDKKTKEIDYKEFFEIIGSYPNSYIAFEKLGVIFGSSKSTAFVMGHQSGMLEGYCVANGISYTKIIPKIWQKEMFKCTKVIKKKDSKKNDTKATALKVAKEIYPENIFKVGKSKIPHDGLVDALLITLYTKKQIKK